MPKTGVDIQNFTRRPSASRAVFSKIATAVLPDWEISLVFVGAAKARALNKQLRNKDYTPNVLSYEAGKKNGEIIICLSEAAKQAPSHEMNERTFILYLFIHGLLHIKGWAHGGRMEQCEQKLLERFTKSPVRATTHVTTHSHRH